MDFEPHVAELIFNSWVQEYDLDVFRDEWLNRSNGVTIDDGKITSITTLSGKVLMEEFS